MSTGSRSGPERARATVAADARSNGAGGLRRLVLFDVDGTLVRGGPARDAFGSAMVSVFGTAGAIDDHEFSGKTDPQIARELLRGAGLEDEQIDAGLPALWRRYLRELEDGLAERPMRVLPGVRELLDALRETGAAALGLVTGNIVDGARLKLGSVDLERRFAVGGYGSDAEVRNRLPAVAVRRAQDHWGVTFSAEAVVIVGDTPRDVACGRAGGHRTVAVATGRIGRDVLDDTGADRVFDDLTRTDAVLETLLE